MRKKEKFLMFVYLDAISKDLCNGTSNSGRIAKEASRIPEDRIPVNPVNAALVFNAYLSGVTRRPFKWMVFHPVRSRPEPEKAGSNNSDPSS